MAGEKVQTVELLTKTALPTAIVFAITLVAGTPEVGAEETADFLVEVDGEGGVSTVTMNPHHDIETLEGRVQQMMLSMDERTWEVSARSEKIIANYERNIDQARELVGLGRYNQATIDEWESVYRDFRHAYTNYAEMLQERYNLGQDALEDGVVSPSEENEILATGRELDGLRREVIQAHNNYWRTAQSIVNGRDT